MVFLLIFPNAFTLYGGFKIHRVTYFRQISGKLGSFSSLEYFHSCLYFQKLPRRTCNWSGEIGLLQNRTDSLTRQQNVWNMLQVK